jgi:poly-gamma-glutamate synthesis protein (capsule biosynthesis protein)
LCPTPDTEALFVSGDARGLFKGLLRVFERADFLIGNLECPLTDMGQGIEKCGPVLKGRRQCLSVLRTAGFGLLALANNHIRDCGDEGVLSTLECCRIGGIRTVGAGKDVFEAKQPVVIEVAGWKIGILAFAEHEFNVASADRPGANAFDLLDSFDDIRDLRSRCDYLLVLYHGGIEYYEYPSPLLQKKCRKMVEAGADLVVCQHSHCVGIAEAYRGGTIVYGQGNTVYGYRARSPGWNRGLVVHVRLEDTPARLVAVEYVPILAGENGTDLMPAEQAQSFLHDWSERSRQSADAAFLQRSWYSFCRGQAAHYLPLLYGLGRTANYVNRKLRNRLVNALYTPKRMRITCNLIRCEAHHEVLQTILEDCDTES